MRPEIPRCPRGFKVLCGEHTIARKPAPPRAAPYGQGDRRPHESLSQRARGAARLVEGPDRDERGAERARESIDDLRARSAVPVGRGFPRRAGD